MKKLIASVVALAATCLVAEATEYEFTVEEGQTKTLKTMVGEQDITFTDGDWIVKKGLGTLNATKDYAAIQLNIRVEEGVYYLPASEGKSVHKSGSQLVVKSGATFNSSGYANALSDSWTVTFEGPGAGFGDNLGAICIGGGESNPVLGSNNGFTMSGDATIYSYGTMNAMFSGTGSGSGPTLDMAGYTLTIRGAKSTSVFRPRWKWSVKNAGPMIVQNGQFARHLTTNDFPSQVPRVTFTDGAKMAAYNTDSFWKFFDSFEFDGTAVLDAGNASPALSTISMKELIGPAKITAAATVTVANRYIAHGDDLVAGKFLSATNTLTFGEGAVIEVDRLAEMALSTGGSYTLMESAGGFSGTPALVGDADEIFTLAEANDGKALVITTKAGRINAIKDWGLALGTEAATSNAEIIAAKLTTLSDNAVVVFPAGVYSFGDGLDLSALTAQNVRFVGSKAVFASPVTLPEAEGFALNVLGATLGTDFVLSVPAYTTLGWSNVLASGLDTAQLAGKRLVKRGSGTFAPAADLSGYSLSGLVVEAGVWSVTADAQLGTLKQQVTVKSGATLYGNGSGTVITNRRLNLAGTGASEQPGALVFGPSSAYNSYSHNELYLEADTTLYSKIQSVSSGAGTFHWMDWVYLNNHTLLLTAPGNTYSFRAGRCFNPASSGTLVISNVTFTCSAEGDGYVFQRRNGAQMHTVLKAAAKLVPDTADAFKVFHDLDCEAGTTISTTPAVAVPLDYLGGAPTSGPNVSGYELKNGYVPHLGTTFASTVPITFGSSAVIDVPDREALFAHRGETLTVLTAPTVAGAPVAGGLNRELFTVTSTETSVSITIASNFVLASAQGIQPENEGSVNAAALATALATLSNDTVVLFDGGVYDFGESMDLSGLAATGVSFVASGATSFKSLLVQPTSGSVSVSGITYRTGKEVYVYVSAGETRTWAEAWQGAGWDASPTGVNLHKVGEGIFAPGESLHAVSVTVFVDEGVLKATASNQLGLGGKAITVADGATLWLCYTSGTIATDRPVKFAGSGASGQRGAVVLDGTSSVWNYCSNVDWELTGDAVMFSQLTAENNGVFLNSSFNLNGYTLTLRGRTDLEKNGLSNYRIGRSCNWKSDGTVVCDKVLVTSSVGDNCGSFHTSNGATGVWRFINGARFNPDDAGVLGLFRTVALDFESGCSFGIPTVSAENKCAEAAVGLLAGAPTFNNERTLVVTNQYTAHAADVVAGKAFTSGKGTLEFAKGCAIEIDGDLSTLPPPVLTLGTASTLNARGKLVAGTNLRAARLRGFVEANALKVGDAPGQVILLR